MLRLHIENTLDEENKMKICKLSDIARFTTGKLNSNAATMKGRYPFFTCAPKPLTIDTYAYDTKAVILAGNNAEGNFHIQYYEGKFNAYQRTYIIETNDETIVDIRYLYYALKICLLHFKQISQGTATKFLTAKILNAFELPIPRIEEQQKIAFLLAEIDEKIKTNEIINNNLFEQMQALYKAWFVDFEPFGGVRPSSWNDTNIYAIANIIYGAPFASKLFNTDGLGKPIIRIRDLKEQAFVTFTTEEHPKGHLIQPGDIVVGMDGEFRPYIWGNEPAWLNQRVCIFESNRPQGKAFVLYTIKPLLNKIEQTQVATTVIHIGKKDFDAFEIILPDEATLDSFDSITAPMIEQIVNNRLQNKRLAVLRDTLLPKLMSGELDVSDIDL